MRIVAIVEGHGESAAVPILIRRIAGEVAPGLAVEIPRPIRKRRNKLTQPGELEKAIRLAARQTTSSDGIVVLIDADDDCPAELGPELLSRARAARSDRRIVVVLAKREFEAWFLAAAESIAGYRALPDDLQSPDEPEAVGSPKAWLRRNMPTQSRYRETIDQPALTGRFDLTAARAAPSFEKFWRDLDMLLTGADA